MSIKPWGHIYRCDYQGLVALGKSQGQAIKNMIRMLIVLEGRHETAD